MRATPRPRRRRAVVAVVLAALAVGRVAAADTGGPDAFGYTFVDSREPNGPAFALIDVATTGAPVLVGTADDRGDDIASVPIDLTGGGTRPGFSFYGVTYAALVMASNGYLTTDVEDGGNDIVNDCPLPQNPAVPVGTHGARIYPLHDDLELKPGLAAGFHQYFPSAVAAGRPPDRGPDVGVHVFLWKGASHFRPDPNPDPPRFDVEVLLYDNGDLVFQYGAGDPDPGATSTTGIQDAAPPTTALLVACNASDSLAPNLAVHVRNPRFADVAITHTVDVASPVAGDAVVYTVIAENVGLVDAGGVQVTDTLPAGLTLEASAFSAGTYAGGIWSLPPLVPGASAVLTLVARVRLDQGGRTIAATATRTAIAAPLFDGVPGNDEATASIAVQLRPPRVGFGTDGDGDGFSDAFEQAAGSSPSDTADTPFGVAANATPLDVRHLRIRLDFARAGRDWVRVSGRLPIANGFSLAGKTVVLDVGGVATAFPLEQRAAGVQGAPAGSRARLRIGRPRRNRAKFAVRVRMGVFAEALAANADLTNADVRRQPRTVRVTLLLPPSVLAKDQAQVYTAAAGRSGRAREAHERAGRR